MRLTSWLVLIFVILSLAVPAMADAPCGRREDVVALLADQFGEAARMQGLSEDNRLMEIWANPETGSWTATMTTPDGITCMPAMGERFQIAQPGDPA